MRMRFRFSFFLLSCVLALHASAGTPEQLAADGDWAALLGSHLATLEKNPQDAQARLGAWRAAMRLGLFEQAAGLEAGINAREQAALEGDRIALGIRHGRIDARTLNGPERYRSAVLAIASREYLASAFHAGLQPDAEERRRLIDSISALAARNGPADAVALYEALLAVDVEVPAWALSDVAGAYLSLRQPRQAEALYRQVLAATPENCDANLGLFYALVESEQLALAQAHIDRFAASLPERRHLDGQPNGERWSAEVASDQARLYADRITEAQRRIEQRLAVTPFNSEARSAEASLHLARGWPRRGEADLRRAIGSDPRNPGLHADRSEVLLSLQDWEQARSELARARSLDAENPRVRQADRTFELHDRRELYVDAGYGVGQNSNPYGSSDWVVDAWLYSSPLAERWRAFVHNYSASADYNGAWTNWVRTGVGAEWRSANWRATGETKAGEAEKVGVLGTLRWQPDDHWKLYATAESLTNNIPLHAVRAGFTASRVSDGGDWQAHESRKLALVASSTDFSDGNLRNNVMATWFERWLSAPRWNFETTLGADTSRNSLGYAAAYFNPPEDRSLWLTAAVENLAWRDYDYAFRQRLALTVGNYWQSGFGNGDTEAIEYHQRWELGRAVSLRYGIGRSLRPYDGEREARNFATLTLLWRF